MSEASKKKKSADKGPAEQENNKEQSRAQYGNYLALLKGFVNETEPAISDRSTLNWNAIMNLAAINNTQGILGYMIMQYPFLADPSYRPYARRTCFHEITEYTRRAESMFQLIEEMDREGIDHLLFKGFIVRNYYNPPELRTYGDIDFVIRKADREKSDRLMKKLGYNPGDDWEPVYSYTQGIEYYEIHTDVMEVDVSDKADYKGYYSHIWEYARKTQDDPDSHTYEFTPEFHFLYLLTHIAKHISVSGAGIRMYMDLALFIRHFGNTLDWDWVKEQLKILSFEDFANITLTSVQHWFGVESPIELRPLPDTVQEDFTRFTLEAGVFGKIGRDRSTVYLKQQDRNNEEVSRFRTILFHAFPPVSSLENRYTYLQIHRWLLPVAWVHRMIDNRESWGRYSQTAKDIMKAEDSEVLRLKRMYKEIGL